MIGTQQEYDSIVQLMTTIGSELSSIRTQAIGAYVINERRYGNESIRDAMYSIEASVERVRALAERLTIGGSLTEWEESS